MHILEVFLNIDIITHDNYISFFIIRLLITLIYNEIFAADAGSCLFRCLIINLDVHWPIHTVELSDKNIINEESLCAVFNVWLEI